MKKIVIKSSAVEAEHLADLLTALEAEAVSLLDSATEELFQLQPDHSPLWQSTQVEAIYPDETNFALLIQQLEHFLGKKLSYSIEEIIEQDWVRLTQASFKPIYFADRLAIYPSWHEFENVATAQVRIDPGLAFGTGTHPTTQLCLEWLANHPPLGKSVIDYGCGSGILALAALALGAKEVWAIDHDPQALEATQHNASLNNFKLNTLLPHETSLSPAELVVANILANPLVELAPTLLKLLKPEARLVLSGLLESETKQILNCYGPHFKQHHITVQENWALISFSNE